MNNTQIRSTKALSRVLLGFVLLGLGCDDKHIELDGGAARAREQALLNSDSTQTQQDTTSSSSATTNSNQSTPEPLALQSEPVNCGTLINTGPRGLACLHCTQREARQQAEIITDILVRSCIKNVAVNFLVDGTFGFDEIFLFNQVTKLTNGGRKLYLVFYLANGPAQRRYDTTEISGFGTAISPSEFRHRIRNDPQLQSSYQGMIDRLVPLMRYALARGASLYLVPMLEDNLDEESFSSMASLTSQAVPSRIPVEIVRNPCGSFCYDGNDSIIPSGILEEKHLDHPHFRSAGGIVTNDGREYSSPAAGGQSEDTISLDDLRSVRNQTAAGNAIFILWSAKRQGLSASSNSLPFPKPENRFYQIPTASEQLELIDFLKEQ